MAELHIRGVEDAGLEAAPVDLGHLDSLGASAKVRATVRVASGRAGGDMQEIKGLTDSSLVELELDGGFRLWTSYGRLAEGARRGALRGSTAPHADVVQLDDMFLPASARADARAGIESLRVFDLDLAKLPAKALEIAAELGEPIDVAALSGELAGKAAGPWLAWLFDRIHMRKPGVFRWHQGALEPLAEPLSDQGPYLVLLHGTASSTEGSFGALRKVDDGAPWRRLTNRYGNRILALEHWTLSESPLANAIQLLEQLPQKKGTELHLVSHSRGGLVGELLAYGMGKRKKALIDADLLRALGKLHPESKRLQKLQQLLGEKQPRIERFVRVACPAAGTTLASGRLDDWLSLLTNLLDYTGLGANPAYQLIKGFMLAAIKTRMDPAAVPGLAAMVPGSAVTRLLNDPSAATDADLAVIAGDVQAKGFLDKLPVWLADRYFQRDHDFVVDTASMYGGLPRTGPRLVHFDSASGVNHFTYFERPRSAARLVEGLLRKERDDRAGFETLEPPGELDEMLAQARRKRGGRAPRADRPIVVLLPGIMGSHLERQKGRRNDRIWLDPFDLLKGGLETLDPARDERIRAEAPIALFYGRLAIELDRSHEVITFPYDWRLSVVAEGQRLALWLKARLSEHGNRPVRLIAHSMGGLVTRAAFAGDPGLWSRFASQAGNRVLFLGTPFLGAYAVARGLLGQDKLIRYLALLDLTHDLGEVLDITSRFQGLLDMLPASAPQLLTEEGWRELKRAQGEAPIGVPAARALDSARAARGLLDGAPLDPERMIYVAGQAAATVSDHRIDPAGGVEFLATGRGDGRVLWDTIPRELPTYWMDAEHGDLCRTEAAFPALLELLETGRTGKLRTEPPSPSRASPKALPLPPDQPVIQPDMEELAVAALGGRRERSRPAPAPIPIRVRHENLLFANAPVIVGHYVGDAFEGSERALDQALGGRLTARRHLNLYPGPIGTADVILQDHEPLGAIVTGLGQVGELDSSRLRQAFAAALRRYALAVRETPGRASDGLEVATLLVGSGEGGLPMREVIEALLQAIQDTQQALDQLDDGAGETAPASHFARVDIIELWEDRAIEAVEALASMVDTARFQGRFDARDQLESGQAGRRRIVVASDDQWRRRLVVTADEATGELRYIAPMERARVEDLSVAGNRAAVDRFVERAVARPSFGKDGDEPGVTLFELLIPNRLKGMGLGDKGLVMILDKVAARYPWELLYDRSQGAQEPMSVRGGMIRQLREPGAPETQPLATGMRALVVGDPITQSDHFAQLDGAKEEAEMVGRRLQRSGFEVTSLIRERQPERILSHLFANGYKVLHLAGHGVFRWTPPSPDGKLQPDLDRRPPPSFTGMVLGDDFFLTPELVSQLPFAPQLVFLNCCHLAKVVPGKEAVANRQMPQLAANLATQFIRIGSQVVIAAGWPVDDEAAALFAERFYEQVFAGRTFFAALHAARRVVFDAFPEAGTWGAYQCYGDPDYRLDLGRREPRATGNPRPGERWKPASRSQLRLELENIEKDAQTLPGVDEKMLGDRLDDALGAMNERGWDGDPEVANAAAKALGELDRLTEAIAAYDRAIAGNKAVTPIRSLEQRANLRARRAAAVARGTEPAPPADPRSPFDPLAEIDQAAASLRDLIHLVGATPERHALLASCHKRRALITTGDDRDAALEDMAHCYALAVGVDPGDVSQEAPAAAPYPLLNWLTAQLLATLRRGAPAAPGLVRLVAGARDAAVAEMEREPSFWNAVMGADADLLLAMVADDLADPQRSAATVAKLAARYEHARLIGSPLKFRSVLEQLELIAEMLRGVPAAQATAASIVALRQHLRR